MEFDWDDAKSARCLQERGFSFADAIPAFTIPTGGRRSTIARTMARRAISSTVAWQDACSSLPIRCVRASTVSSRHARQISARRGVMARTRLKVDQTVVEILPDGSERAITPRTDWSRVDATTVQEIATQITQDEAEAMRDAAAYARRVRRRVGLSQVAFARRIGVPVDTVRNWEQGKRAPQGPARALLRIIDRAPETALQALGRD
jgi:putative transcriptional regulator